MATMKGLKKGIFTFLEADQTREMWVDLGQTFFGKTKKTVFIEKKIEVGNS